MILVHSSEIETLKTFILKEKRLDLLGRKEAMMDVLMIAILLGCFGLVKAFADFCDWQIKPKEK